MKTLGKVLVMLYGTAIAVVSIWALFSTASGNGEEQVPNWVVWVLVPGMLFTAGMLGYLVYLGWRWVFEQEGR